MEWQDKGIVIGVRKHGETSSIVETMTAAHGRALGLVRGGRSSRMRPILQPGNSVDLVWRARLEDHLGVFQVEGDNLRAANLMTSQIGIYGLQTISSHLRLLPEREAHLGLYNACLVVLDNLDDPETAARLLIRFELALLAELGFGLDLSRCAASNDKRNLIWVSPKSGRAVSAEAGKPYESQLLSLPHFLLEEGLRHGDMPSNKTVGALLEDGFKLTQYFMQRNVYGPRGLKTPEERTGLVRKISRMIEEQQQGLIQ